MKDREVKIIGYGMLAIIILISANAGLYFGYSLNSYLLISLSIFFYLLLGLGCDITRTIDSHNGQEYPNPLVILFWPLIELYWFIKNL